MRPITDLELDEPGASVLLLAAHPDDVEIGAGGTVLSLAAAHPTLRIDWFVASATPQRRTEAEAAAHAFVDGDRLHLSVGDAPDGWFPEAWGPLKRSLQDLRDRVPAPRLVLAPSRHDRHQDHAVLGSLAWQTWRDAAVLAYEIPKLEAESVPSNLYVPLADDVAARKVELLRSHHASQHTKPWYDAELFRAHLRLRGVQAKTRWAEGFQAETLLLTP